MGLMALANRLSMTIIWMSKIVFIIYKPYFLESLLKAKNLEGIHKHNVYLFSMQKFGCKINA